MSTTATTPNFSGSIPANYEQYLGPMFFEPYAGEISQRFDSSAVADALEIGCGTGRVTRHLRKVLPPIATLVASDVSPEMLAIAQQKLRSEPVEWRIINAEVLPFPGASVDLIVCYFGFMFVPDKAKAYAEAFKILRKGGMLLMATWDRLEHNEASHVFRKTIKKYLGDNLPHSYKLPFAMCDADPITAMLRDAGFSKTNAEQVEKISHAETAAKAAQGLVRGGSLYNEIVNRNPAWVDEIISVVERELGEKYGNPPMNASMKALIIQAWK